MARRLTGSQTTPEYRRRLTAGFQAWQDSQNKGLTGSETTPEYKSRLTAGFAKGLAPAPDPNALPVDPTYDQQIGVYGKRRDDSYADLTNQRTGGLLDYGYTEQQDGTGKTTGLTFDPSNPNSRAALLLKHYQQSKAGTQNSMAARGQLYAGARVNAQNANDSNYQVADDQQRKALLQFLARNSGAARDAGTNYEANAGVAQGDRISRAIAAKAASGDAGPEKPDFSKWIVTTFMKNGVKWHKLADGSLVKA
jgi:hypothetical protein